MGTTTLRTILSAASLLAASHLTAGVIFNSNSTAANPTEFNANGANVTIAKNPAWSDPIPGSNWISFENTGDPNSPNFVTLPNGTITKFYQDFSLTAADTAVNGSISVLADDSSSIVLNGITLTPEASQVGNTYSTCSDTRPNCETVYTVLLPSADLLVGANVLEFDVAQRAGSSYGLDYSGTAGVPEPATMGLMGLALLAAGVVRRKTGPVVL